MNKWMKVRKRDSMHMFCNFDPDTWLKALEKFSNDTLSLTLTGGECFY